MTTIKNQINPDSRVFQRTYWVNVFSADEMSGEICLTEAEAMDQCTCTEGMPDAIQVEVKIIPLSQTGQNRACGGESI